MSPIDPIKEKLAKLVAMLASPNDDERRSAWRALNKVLTGGNASFVDLALWIHDPDKSKAQSGAHLLSDAEVKELYDAAYAQGLADGQQSGAEVPGPLPLAKMAADMAPYWRELDLKHHQFVTDMIRRIRCGDLNLTPRQADYFRSLYLKLGRRHGFTI